MKSIYEFSIKRRFYWNKAGIEVAQKYVAGWKIRSIDRFSI